MESLFSVAFRETKHTSHCIQWRGAQDAFSAFLRRPMLSAATASVGRAGAEVGGLVAEPLEGTGHGVALEVQTVTLPCQLPVEHQ